MMMFVDKNLLLGSLTDAIQSANYEMARATNKQSDLYIASSTIFDTFTRLKEKVEDGDYDVSIKRIQPNDQEI